jgi:GT2 family glycosyltransferase
MIDVEFGLRAREMDVKSLCIPAISVIHGIGNRRKGAAKFAPTNYSNGRKYLQTRNRVIIWKRFYRGSAKFLLSDMLIWAMDSARTVIFESGRRDKARSIMKGILDGLAFKERL